MFFSITQLIEHLSYPRSSSQLSRASAIILAHPYRLGPRLARRRVHRAGPAIGPGRASSAADAADCAAIVLSGPALAAGAASVVDPESEHRALRSVPQAGGGGIANLGVGNTFAETDEHGQDHC